MQNQPLIEIDNATVYRGDTRVFDDFSLLIGQGEQVAIVGPNGAGKTTLLKLVNRELYPVQKAGSRLRILGRETWNVWDLRQHIGLVSDDLRMRYPLDAVALDVVMSGFFSSIGTHGIVAEGVTDEHRRRARAALEAFGAGHVADVALRRLSTGQQRRCLLARAMVHDPHTLILDEPMAGLDVAASFDYLERIEGLIEAGRSIVLVTHHLNEIPPGIDRVVLLTGGRIVADGPKYEVLTAENLEATFGLPVRVTTVDDWFFVLPQAR